LSQFEYENTQHSYLEYYTSHIKPLINKLDISIKCKDRLRNKDLAQMLNLSETEIEQIRTSQNIKYINQKSIMKILESGNSSICRLFQREMEIGSPFTYTIEQLAYIYDLDEDKLTDVCSLLNIREITWQNMPEVFSAMPYN